LEVDLFRDAGQLLVLGAKQRLAFYVDQVVDGRPAKQPHTQRLLGAATSVREPPELPWLSWGAF
jgi:hypothetical protein